MRFSKLQMFIACMFLSACVSDQSSTTTNTSSQPRYSQQNQAAPSIQNEQTKCNNKEGEACYRLAGRYRTGLGIDKDFKKAQTLFLKACDLQTLSACHNAAAMYRTGSGVPVSMDKAMALYEKACNGGLVVSCNTGGLAIALNPQATKNEILKAKEYFGKSCELKNADGCKFQRLYADLDAGKDISKSLYDSNFEFECYEGNYAACAKQAEIYSSGSTEGVPQDLGKALEFHNRACLGGNIGASCHVLGKVLIPSEKNIGDMKAALNFFNRGCNSGYAESCKTLSLAYLVNPDLVPMDIEKSRMYRKKYCSLSPGVCK